MLVKPAERRHRPWMIVCKIFRRLEWEAFEASGRFDGSPDDLRDGFIHLSTPEQLEGTLARHFAGEADLVMVELAIADDPALKLEVSRNGALFPHLYRPLLAADVMRPEPGPQP